MQNFFRMSYFMPPIAPIRNEQGQTVTPATLTPSSEELVRNPRSRSAKLRAAAKIVRQ